MAVTAGSTTRGENTAYLLLVLLCQSGENKCVCNSYDSLCFLPASLLVPCLAWVDSVRPHRRQPSRLPRPWDSPGKNTGVGCHFLLQCMEVKSESEVAQSCPTLRDPMDCSLPGSSAHGIFQARVLEWGAIAFSKLPIIFCKIQETRPKHQDI